MTDLELLHKIYEIVNCADDSTATEIRTLMDENGWAEDAPVV